MLVTEEWKRERLKRAYSGELNVPARFNRATQALFWEYRYNARWKERNFHPMYNLSRKDHNDTLSMQQIYLQCATEYEAAMVLLGNWEHWERLCRTSWFPKHLEKWRAEKAIKDGHLGREKLLEAASKGNLSAAKYLDQDSKKSDTTNKKKVPKPKQAELGPPEKKQDDSEWVEQALAKLKE